MKKSNETAVAYHEAGHAVVAYQLFGLKRIRKITIIPKEDALGHVKNKMIMKGTDYETENSPAFEGKIMREIMQCFAGHIAEKKITGRSNNIGASTDFSQAFGLAERIDSGWDTKISQALQDYLYIRTEALVNFKWNLIKAVAKELLIKKTLNRDDFYKITEDEFKKDLEKFQKKRKITK